MTTTSSFPCARPAADRNNETHIASHFESWHESIEVKKALKSQSIQHDKVTALPCARTEDRRKLRIDVRGPARRREDDCESAFQAALVMVCTKSAEIMSRMPRGYSTNLDGNDFYLETNTTHILRQIARSMSASNYTTSTHLDGRQSMFVSVYAKAPAKKLDYLVADIMGVPQTDILIMTVQVSRKTSSSRWEPAGLHWTRYTNPEDRTASFSPA